MMTFTPYFVSLLSLGAALQHWGEYDSITDRTNQSITCNYWNGFKFPRSEKYAITLYHKDSEVSDLPISQKRCASNYWLNYDGFFDFNTRSTSHIRLDLVNHARQLAIENSVDNQDIFGMAYDCYERFSGVKLPEVYLYNGMAHCSVRNSTGTVELTLRLKSVILEVSSRKYEDELPDPYVNSYDKVKMTLAVSVGPVCELTSGSEGAKAELILEVNNADSCKKARVHPDQPKKQASAAQKPSKQSIPSNHANAEPSNIKA